MDWINISKLAGKHGIRYPTNISMQDFISELRTLLQTEAQAERDKIKARYENWRPIEETPNTILIMSNVLFDFYCEEPDADGEDSSFSLTTTWDERPEQAVAWCRIVTPRWPDEADFRRSCSVHGGSRNDR